ncbi:MAG: AAA family ATPase [Paracoccaceae bacterium]
MNDEQRIDELAREYDERLSRSAWEAINPHDDYPEDPGEGKRISATPFVLPDPATIPPRRWIYGRQYQRGEVTAMIAPPGIGKTTFEIGTALAMASGRDLFGKDLPEGALRVWVWNLEDDLIELSRQIAAGAIHHGVTAEDLADRLFVDGLDKLLCTAVESENGPQLVEPIYAALTAELKRRKIDVLKVDPFVSSHSINENDNGIVDAVTKRWKRVAQECNCAILLVHHTRKTGGNAVTVEDSRGASSLSGAVRTALTLNHMSEDEANRFGITDPAERRTIVRVDNGKSNRAPPESAFWFKLHGEDLGNGDNVAAAARWTPPDPFDGLSVRDLYNVQQAIAGGEWAQSIQAGNWAGKAVAEALGLDACAKADRARISALLRNWIASGALLIENRHDSKKGRERPFVVVGNAVDPTTLPTPKSGVGKGGERQASNPIPTPPPYRGGEWGGVGSTPAEPSGEGCARCDGVGCAWCDR